MASVGRWLVLLTVTLTLMAAAEANRPRTWSWRRTSKTPPPFKYDKQSHRKWKGLSNGCACHDFGSKARHCDIITGQCTCRPNVTGLKCDQCQTGYWNLQSGKGCKSCQCDVIGSLNGACDTVSGSCACRPGVGGLSCDACLPGFFSFSSSGCKECDVCDKAGHVCDADTGRCVCPPWTEGDRCQNCAANAWNYHPLKGCTACNCNSYGSLSNQCDHSTGACRCRPGFAGATCDRCASGHYGFPHCYRCECHAAGTAHCPGGQCQCHPTSGQCPCKKNAVGRTCSACRATTFGLDTNNVDGCTPCFCFGRTSSCTHGDFVWSSLRMDAERGLTINYDHPLRPPNAVGANQFPVNTQEICYINLALPGEVELKFKLGETQLNVTNNLRIIPDVHGDVMIGVSQSFDTPLYWKLPPFFLGDRILSYNGYLRFSVTNEGGTTFFPDNILATYPLVQMQGNRRLVLEYYPKAISPDGHYQVRLHESLWRMKNNPRGVVSREMMMVALQNVQHILIRATDSMDRNKARLSQVSLDVATATSTTIGSLSLASARGIEVCQCPGNYAATSCQDPNIGFWRHFKTEYITSTIIIDLVGQSQPCRCNSRSETCHKETGHCTNCRENTSGEWCHVCAPGFHGDPARGQPCRACPCPTTEWNHADSCHFTAAHRLSKCTCSLGYRGERCDRCDYGFYGNAHQGECRPCRCDRLGSVSDECDEITGQCNCKPGITGRDCTYCAPRHVISPSGCSSCQEGCTGHLFVSIDAMSASIQHLNVSHYVPLPWKTLLRYENSTVMWEGVFQQSADNWLIQQQLATAPNYLPLSQLNLQMAKQLVMLAPTVLADSAASQSESAQMLMQSQQLETIIRDLVAYLKNYAIGETSSLSIDKAMIQIENHWNYIKSINTSARASSAILELEHSEKLMKSLGNLSSWNSLEAALAIRDHLGGFQIRIEDLQYHVDQSHNFTQAAVATVDIINAMLSNVRQTIRHIMEASERCEIHLNSASIRNINASMAITNCHVTSQSLRTLLVVMTSHMAECSYKSTELTRLNPVLRREYVIRAQKHADHLLALAYSIVNRFNATRDVADLPLQAANAYGSIVEALHLAHQAALDADQAAEIAYTKVYPNDLDLSLVTRAQLARDKSMELLAQSEQLQARVVEHQQKLKGDQSLLDGLKLNLQTAWNINQESSIIINKLPRVRDRVKAAVEKSMDALMTLTTESQRVDDVSHQMETQIFSRVNSVKSSRNIALGNLPKLVEDTRKKMKMAEAKILQLTKKNFQFRTANNSIHQKLDELRNKILRAKQAASSIRVSLSGNGNCQRTLTPTTLQPSSMTTISLTYALNKDHRDSLLFYLPARRRHGNDKDVDFLALEMVDRKIRFVWNVGGGTQVLTHPLDLLPISDDLNDDSRWYHILVQRTGHVASLDVRPVKDDGGGGGASGSTKVTGTGASRFTKLDLTTGDRIYIGVLPPNPSTDVKTSKFYGHLHQLWFDGQPVGLWNFLTSNKGCSPSIEGAQKAVDESSYRFNGMGYAQLAQIPRYDPRQYSITFSFKSLDENALLFLAIDNKETQYISLELTEGFVRYEVRYGSNHEMSLQSRRKYNTGQWIKVEASRVLIRGVETALLKVADDEELSAAPFHLGVPVLELEDARLYIGGLPPDVNIPKRLMTTVPGSFLGCMKDLQVVAFGMNPLQGSFYGVEASCSSASDKIAAFHGHGYLQLRSSSVPKSISESSVGFTFKTSTNDGILLYVLPTSYEFEEQPSNSIDHDVTVSSAAGGKEGDMLSVVIRAGRLEARFKSNEKMLSITSKETFNDDLFHNVVINRNGRRVELLVDDVLVGTQRLGRSSPHSPSHFHLMVGGIRPELGHFAAAFIGTQHSFNGCIADITFSNELIDMKQPVKHSGVAVGRCQHVPSARNLEERMQASEKALSSCREVPQYTIEGRAFKFGDVPYSHVMLSTQHNDPESGFNVTLDFRTHYPNGLLLFSSVKRKKNSELLAVALKNGHVVVNLQGKKKQHLLTSTVTVNDGHWHKIDLLKVKRLVTLVVDKETKRTKMAKLFKLDHSIFIGGLPEVEPASYSYDGFKGCIRNVYLNGSARDLASDGNIIHRVGQCFAHVETGSYFPGDAYAVYSNDFRVGPMVDIQLQFRTTELNGVLLSVPEKRGSASLSLSIDDGSMVFAVDMGHNVTFAVRQTMASPYQLCDNRWHSVKANYVENALTLKVDSMDEQYAFSSSGHLVETSASRPLFIGGLPDLELQETLTVRDNFKGCIRNVVIRGEIKDWTDMARLNNVLLNACPIQ